ncbi:MAG: hypothetical protein HOO93_07150 [Methyloglobulus sp.]|nr:hypothetical protein [Methyloglobulus sp.]
MQPRPECFDVTASFEPYGYTPVAGRGMLPRSWRFSVVQVWRHKQNDWNGVANPVPRWRLERGYKPRPTLEWRHNVAGRGMLPRSWCFSVAQEWQHKQNVWDGVANPVPR